MQQKSILALPLYNEFCFLKATSQDVQSLNTIFVNRKVLYHVASDVRNSQARSRECFCNIYTLGFHKSLQNKVDYDTIVRGDGAGPAGTAAAGPMLEAKLMNLIKGRLQKF